MNRADAGMSLLRKLGACALMCVVAMFAMCGAAQATLISTNTIQVSSGDPTQLGRPSRNGIPQDWTGSEPFPGVINLATSYHYFTLDLDLDALEAGFTTFGEFLQISFDSVSGLTFLSAYEDSYDPSNKSANWLGDAGISGNFFGVDPLFFQVVVGAGHHLILVLNETSPNGGLDQPGTVLVEAFADTEFTDLTPIPEPATLSLLLIGAIGWLAVRRRGASAV